MWGLGAATMSWLIEFLCWLCSKGRLLHRRPEEPFAYSAQQVQSSSWMLSSHTSAWQNSTVFRFVYIITQNDLRTNLLPARRSGLRSLIRFHLRVVGEVKVVRMPVYIFPSPLCSEMPCNERWSPCPGRSPSDVSVKSVGCSCPYLGLSTHRTKKWFGVGWCLNFFLTAHITQKTQEYWMCSEQLNDSRT